MEYTAENAHDYLYTPEDIMSNLELSKEKFDEMINDFGISNEFVKYGDTVYLSKKGHTILLDKMFHKTEEEVDVSELVTGSQLAEQLNSSPSRISQIINQLGLSDNLIKSGTKKYIPKDDEAKIADYLVNNARRNHKEKTEDSSDNTSYLVEQIKQLKAQIESLESDKAYLQSTLDENKKTITSLVSSNYNLTNRVNQEVESADNFRKNAVKLERELYDLKSLGLFKRIFDIPKAASTYDDYLEIEHDEKYNEQK